jgi:hypothetical protein
MSYQSGLSRCNNGCESRISRHSEMRKRLKIIETKLGREKALGQYWEGSRLIEIDPRLASKIYLKAMIHELLHDLFPNLSEKVVTKTAIRMANVLWQHNVRILRK